MDVQNRSPADIVYIEDLLRKVKSKNEKIFTVKKGALT